MPGGHLQVRQEYGVKKDLLGLLEGRETYVIGKDGIVKLVSPLLPVGCNSAGIPQKTVEFPCHTTASE